MPVRRIVFGEAEAVGADDHAILKNHVVAEAAMLANDGMSVGEEIVPDRYTAIHNDVGRSTASFPMVTSRRSRHRARYGALADLGGGMHDCGGVNARGVVRRLVEKFQGTGKGQVRILAAQQSAWMAGKSSATMMAEALVLLAAPAYLGLATKVMCPGPASSIPATPVISVSGEPLPSGLRAWKQSVQVS